MPEHKQYWFIALGLPANPNPSESTQPSVLTTRHRHTHTNTAAEFFRPWSAALSLAAGYLIKHLHNISTQQQSVSQCNGGSSSAVIPHKPSERPQQIQVPCIADLSNLRSRYSHKAAGT